MKHSASQSVSSIVRLSLAAAALAAPLLFAGAAGAQAAEPAAPAPAAAPTLMAAEATPAPAAPTADAPAAPSDAAKPAFRLGAHAELDVGALAALKQGAAFAGGVVYGPFRLGMSYATFLSNKSFGGTPDGFSMRANYIVGFNAAYFIGQRTDKGLYVQAMFHIKQQGITNLANGAHRDLDSLAAGLEVGYVWKVYRGLYVAPRVGALYYVKKPQGSGNHPVDVGGREYDNNRHKNFDTYLIPTLSVGYSW